MPSPRVQRLRWREGAGYEPISSEPLHPAVLQFWDGADTLYFEPGVSAHIPPPLSPTESPMPAPLIINGTQLGYILNQDDANHVGDLGVSLERLTSDVRGLGSVGYDQANRLQTCEAHITSLERTLSAALSRIALLEQRLMPQSVPFSTATTAPVLPADGAPAAPAVVGAGTLVGGAEPTRVADDFRPAAAVPNADRSIASLERVEAPAAVSTPVIAAPVAAPASVTLETLRQEGTAFANRFGVERFRTIVANTGGARVLSAVAPELRAAVLAEIRRQSELPVATAAAG